MQVTKLNLWDLTNLVRSPEYKEANKDRYAGHYLTTPKPHFHGFESIDDIDSILNAEVQNNGEYITNNRTFDMVPDVCGAIVNMDAYIQGQPEDMYNFVSSDSNIVEDLNLYISLPYMVRAADIAAAAQRIKSYVESRPANVSININIRTDYKTYDDSKRIKEGKKVNTILINVCNADDYLTPQVINLIGHPMFYRWVILSYQFNKHNCNSIPQPCPPDYINFLTFNKTW